MSTIGDMGDQAKAIAEMHLGLAMQNRREEGPGETGRCLNCGEPVSSGRRWCNAECRDEWQDNKQ